jgi:hypothetical protein
MNPGLELSYLTTSDLMFWRLLKYCAGAYCEILSDRIWFCRATGYRHLPHKLEVLNPTMA